MSPREMTITCVQPHDRIRLIAYLERILFMNIRNYFWFIPFCFFITTYITFSLFLDTTLQLPNVVGTSLEDAIQTLSAAGLNCQISSYRDTDEQQPPSKIPTILNQSPSAGQAVKKQQTVYLIISRPHSPPLAPDWVDKTLTLIQKEAITLSIKVQLYWICSPQISDTCLVQIPAPGNPLDEQKTVIVYLAQPSETIAIMPSFIDQQLNEAVFILHNQGLKPEIVHPPYKTSKTGIVKRQRPQPGALIDLNKPLNVQLYVD